MEDKETAGEHPAGGDVQHAGHLCVGDDVACRSWCPCNDSAGGDPA